MTSGDMYKYMNILDQCRNSSALTDGHIAMRLAHSFASMMKKSDMTDANGLGDCFKLKYAANDGYFMPGPNVEEKYSSVYLGDGQANQLTPLVTLGEGAYGVVELVLNMVGYPFARKTTKNKVKDEDLSKIEKEVKITQK